MLALLEGLKSPLQKARRPHDRSGHLGRPWEKPWEASAGEKTEKALPLCVAQIFFLVLSAAARRGVNSRPGREKEQGSLPC